MTSPQYQADEYQREQQAAVIAAVAAAGVAAGLAGYQLANFTVFMRFLRSIWPAVLAGRQRAAWSARNYFDRERLRVTGLPQLEVPLIPEYQFDWFVQDMKPAYQMAVKQIRVARESEKIGVPVPPPRVEAAVRVSAAKVVANAGREQMIAAVETDALLKEIASPNLRESRKELAKTRLRKTWGDQWVEDAVQELDVEHPDVVGWARVATGDETCAFCMMLVSRGPVFTTSAKAGANIDEVGDQDVIDLFGAGADIPMDEWHTGCDCQVVPVFDKTDWPGKQAADAALEKWQDASEGFVYDPDKKYRVGKKQSDGTWKFTSVTLTEAAARYRETLNNLRFTVEGRDPQERQRVSKDQLDELLAAIPGAAKLFAKELTRR